MHVEYPGTFEEKVIVNGRHFQPVAEHRVAKVGRSSLNRLPVRMAFSAQRKVLFNSGE